jgi:hypothetical protein
VQIVSERSTFDEDPAAFHKRYAEKQVGLGTALTVPSKLTVLSKVATSSKVSLNSICCILTAPHRPSLVKGQPVQSSPH